MVASLHTGMDGDAHARASGKLLLALADPATREAYLTLHPPERRTERTLVDRAQLDVEFEQIREQGYATLVDELEDGLSVVGAPVRDADGTVVAALTVAGATLRLPPARLRLLGRVTLEQAAVLADAIRAPL